MLTLVQTSNLQTASVDDLPPPLPPQAELPWLNSMFERKGEITSDSPSNNSTIATPASSGPWDFLRRELEARREAVIAAPTAAPIVEPRPVISRTDYSRPDFTPHKWSDAKAMRARYAGTCKETGVTINEGDWMLYDMERRNAFHASSPVFQKYIDFLTAARNRAQGSEV